ncbi:ArsR/SmtB family transcription factor [Bacillus sp. JJ1764]|uniref:ArsR/SmtB family transcription factor n=1 Tax=Bacillus sp. JJ1764 TaxID=3122964 RepID=UPI0030003C97
MQHIYSPLSQEKLHISVESSPVWEAVLGIAAYTHSKLRHTFEHDERWLNHQSNMSAKLVSNLKEIEQTNLWYGLLMLQHKLCSSNIQDFSNGIYEMEPELFYEALLPYMDRANETLRKKTAKNYKNTNSFIQFAANFNDHEYLRGYVLSLVQKERVEIIGLLNDTISEWCNWISKHEDWGLWLQALSIEQKKYNVIDVSKPVEEIERITGGTKYLPEPSVWHVKLIPHVSYRPWVLELRTSETKLFFYPLNEDALLGPGIPPQELVQGHKALGDELRLKLLYQILKGPYSLQELSTKFNVSKTTLHHQLSLLKASKFIRVEKGIYSANTVQIQSFSKRLNQYLGEPL